MRARSHLFARSRTLASQAGFRAANPALTHVLERMLVSHTPAFRVYPSAQEEGMPPFGRIGTPGPRILLALDHPNFEHTSIDCLREAYRDCISPESAAAKTHANGMEVFLCKPENKVVQKSEIVEPVDLSKDTIELGVRGSIHHVIVWSYETVQRDACFGGWPAAALVPTTPLRLLRFDVRTMWPTCKSAPQAPSSARPASRLTSRLSEVVCRSTARRHSGNCAIGFEMVCPSTWSSTARASRYDSSPSTPGAAPRRVKTKCVGDGRQTLSSPLHLLEALG